MDTRWIVDNRPSLARPSPGHSLLGQHDEWEATIDGPVLVRTLFLRGSECRFHCTMCDLWQYTFPGVTPPGDIPLQVQQGLSNLAASDPQPTWLKLYNSSSFFDAKNVPVEDRPLIAQQAQAMQRLVVENHPRLTTHQVLDEFLEQLNPVELEVAMGLETVHPEILPKLNKQMSVADFRQAVEQCHASHVAVRAFVLLQTPWLGHVEAMKWCQATIDAAAEMGVEHVAVIPVRAGNGAIDRLAGSGDFTPPTAAMLEQILSENLEIEQCVVTVDLWDWDKLRGTCAACSEARRQRMCTMNLHRRPLPTIPCERCDDATANC